MNPTKLYYCFTVVKLLRQRQAPTGKITIEIAQTQNKHKTILKSVLNQPQKNTKETFPISTGKYKAASLKPAGLWRWPPCWQLHKSLKMVWLCIPLPLTEVSWFFLFVLIFYSRNYPAGQDCFSIYGEEVWFRHFFTFLWSTLQPLYWDNPRESTHLIQTKESQVPEHIQGTDPGSCGDLSSYL